MQTDEYKTNLLLFLIFLTVTIVVLINSTFDVDGYLSPDSTQYLAFAQKLLEGDSLFFAGENTSITNSEHFGVWPIAYPVTIYWIAELTGYSVFVSSKIVNLIFFGMSIWILKQIFAHRAVLFASVLALGSYLQIFSFSWSEGPFIFSLLWFCHSLLRYLSSMKTVYLFSILLSALCLFVFRYVGAFSLVVIGMFAVGELWKKNIRGFINLSVVATIALSFMIIYLHNNYVETGWITGRERVPVYENTSDLISMTLKGILQEFALIIGRNINYFWDVIAVQMILLFGIFYYSKNSHASTNTQKNEQFSRQENMLRSHIFLLTGLSYGFCLIALRWYSHFDNLNSRLLSPATLLIIIALIDYIVILGNEFWNKLTRHLTYSLAILSIVMALFQTLHKASEDDLDVLHNYRQQITATQVKYNAVNSHAVIIFGSTHMRYLNINLIIKRPFSHPSDKDKETIQNYLANIVKKYPSKQIVIDIAQGVERCEKLHESWCIFLNRQEQKDFYLVQK